MGWKHYQTVDHPKREPQVGSGLFGTRVIHQIFNISYFPQFNLSFEKKSLFPKTPKNHPKIYTKLPNSGQRNKRRDLASLET